MCICALLSEELVKRGLVHINFCVEGKLRHNGVWVAQAARGPKLRDMDWSPRLLSYEPRAFHAFSFKILTTSPWRETFELREVR